MNSYKSYTPKKSEIERQWYIVDAEGMVLGRLATEIAKVLQGKNKPTYAPHIDTGDYVIVINAEKIKLTGKKWEQKQHWHHTGYPGGQKFTPYSEIREKHPTRMLEYAVTGMLPKNTLGRQMIKKLKLYAGEDHPHEAQQPIELKI